MMCSPLLQAKNPDLGLQTHGTMNKEQLEALNNTKVRSKDGRFSAGLGLSCDAMHVMSGGF